MAIRLTVDFNSLILRDSEFSLSLKFGEKYSSYCSFLHFFPPAEFLDGLRWKKKIHLPLFCFCQEEKCMLCYLLYSFQVLFSGDMWFLYGFFFLLWLLWMIGGQKNRNIFFSLWMDQAVVFFFFLKGHWALFSGSRAPVLICSAPGKSHVPAVVFDIYYYFWLIMLGKEKTERRLPPF